MYSNDEHSMLLERSFSHIPGNIQKILDAGSGKTSLSILCNYYKTAEIDAIIFPGDTRKRNSITENIFSERVNLMELDICKGSIIQNYDLTLAHLLLGEALKWGNNVETLLEKLLCIDSEYFVIYDYKEDDTINYSYVENYFKESGHTVVCKDEQTKQIPQEFVTFVGKTYISYVIIGK
jgi:predicted RNA methylase